MSRRSAAILVLSLIGFVVWVVLSRPPRMPPFQQAVEELRERMLPEHAVDTKPILERTDWRATADWTIETTMTWAEYRSWISRQLGKTYRVTKADDRQSVFRHNGVNEIHDVSVSADRSSGQIHVHYSVSAW